MSVDNAILKQLIQEMNDHSSKQIKTVLDLLEEGNTVPFIARYRKDQTGALDEVQIRDIDERYQYLSNLNDRKKSVIESIKEQGQLTDELKQEILNAAHLQEVEDLYRPYKKKRRTKATIAKEKGLEPLADWLLTFPDEDVNKKASEFINEKNKVDSSEDALAGAHEIIAEYISDQSIYRKRVRDFLRYNAVVTSKIKDESKDMKKVYEVYYDYSEPYREVADHRVLALNRGEAEGVLSVNIESDLERMHRYAFKQEIPEDKANDAVEFVKVAIIDAFKRFIEPAIVRELRSHMTEEAEEAAIDVFGENLRNLLLQAPLKNKVILGLDPAFRTGCKLAVIDQTGKVLAIKVIYPHSGDNQYTKAKKELTALLKAHNVDYIAIGNGTASRESELFVADVVSDLSEPVSYVIVNEAGASVYSASEEARREFPDLQVEERSAVSIARRLQDPLAELVKIEPKSIGVGQYQHDVSQNKLTNQLDFVVETAVNQVGVNVNTASSALLEHISGLTKTTAQNIVAFREEHGQFTKRQELKDVKRLGPKSYEQSVGFLRIPEAKEPLDQTGIHPESYKEAEAILKNVGFGKENIGTPELKRKLGSVDKKQLIESIGMGAETYADIVKALTAPGRDMREDMSAPLLRTDVLEMEDLKEGMQLEGTIRNVVDFGAFVDIGVKEDGLVHISKLSKTFVNHPKDVVAVGDIVTVWIESIDIKKGRIALTMIDKS